MKRLSRAIPVVLALSGCLFSSKNEPEDPIVVNAGTNANSQAQVTTAPARVDEAGVRAQRDRLCA